MKLTNQTRGRTPWDIKTIESYKLRLFFFLSFISNFLFNSCFFVRLLLFVCLFYVFVCLFLLLYCLFDFVVVLFVCLSASSSFSFSTSFLL